MFNKNISKRLSLYAVISGLMSGLALFPNQTFDKSLLIGNLLPTSYFPGWISTALLFWSFVLAVFVPVFVIFLFNKRDKIFEFKGINKKLTKIS